MQPPFFNRWVALAVFACMGLNTVAQSPATAPSAGEPTAQQAADSSATMPSADTIERQLLDAMQDSDEPIPATESGGQQGDDFPAMAGAPDVDHNILGVAPGEKMPKLRREGEFIVSRRGRIIPAANGRHMLFVFEADSEATPEPPMILAPCQMLQNMEDIVRERGDKVIFILSGQILVYRGANYLLPTMMKLAIDHGNLTH